MKITVKVYPKSKIESIEKISEREFKVRFNVPPEHGRANKKLVEILAEYFEVSLSEICIISGTRSKKKIVEIVKQI